jgi:glycosyltransferase involved in cell wall biosynthesis
MPSERPLLTIAIPTYNRAHLLDGLLALMQDEMHSQPGVELLVSDNASTDGTAELLEAYQCRVPEIRILRNETNTGADANILQCFEKARGKYVWIFSDDDLIARGSLGRVLEAISGTDYELVGIRYYSFVGDYNGHREYRPAKDREYSRAEDLARQMHVFFTFISGNIVNKERIEAVPHPPFASLVGTGFVQLGFYFTALNNHRRSRLIRDPIIAARGNVSVGYPLYRIFGPTMCRVVHDWVESPRIRQMIIRGTIRRFFPYWIIRGRESSISSVAEDPHAVLRTCYGSDFRYWVFDFPIYALPLRLARIWLFGLRVVNKIDSVIGNSRVSA